MIFTNWASSLWCWRLQWILCFRLDILLQSNQMNMIFCLQSPIPVLAQPRRVKRNITSEEIIVFSPGGRARLVSWKQGSGTIDRLVCSFLIFWNCGENQRLGHHLTLPLLELEHECVVSSPSIQTVSYCLIRCGNINILLAALVQCWWWSNVSSQAIDVWSNMCVSFVFLALLEYALVNYAARADARYAGWNVESISILTFQSRPLLKPNIN